MIREIKFRAAAAPLPFRVETAFRGWTYQLHFSQFMVYYREKEY
jgi:hypothetical protein